MIRATLDVNVLASGFPATRGVPVDLVARWGDQAYELVLSEHILAGLQRTWRKPYFRLRYDARRVAESLRLIRTSAILVEPADSIRGIAEDEEDDLILGTAVAGRVDFLVTGDRRFRALDSFQGITILTPREFLNALEAEDAQSR